jgi:hypothetical protein
MRLKGAIAEDVFYRMSSLDQGLGNEDGAMAAQGVSFGAHDGDDFFRSR